MKKASKLLILEFPKEREIEQLLKTGQIKVACANPDCEDHSLFSTRRHTFQVSLYNLIEVRIR